MTNDSSRNSASVSFVSFAHSIRQPVRLAQMAIVCSRTKINKPKISFSISGSWLFPINKQQTARLQFLQCALAAIKEGFVIKMNNFAILLKQDHVPVKDAASSRFIRATAQLQLPLELDALKQKKDYDSDEESNTQHQSSGWKRTALKDLYTAQIDRSKKPKLKSGSGDLDTFSITLSLSVKTSKYASKTGLQLY
eukprot:329-Rhodomonas_salina.1